MAQDPPWGELEAAIAGAVILPESAGYDVARRPAIANFRHVRPQAVVRCRSASDVAETLRFAARTGVPLAVRGGGHCFAGRSSGEGIVLDTGSMDSVAVSGDLVTVGAGCRLGPVYDALAEHDATIPAGCGPDVGVAGLALGGGLGILGRVHGLTSDRWAAAEVVLADGRIVECDEERHPDLFWALRGAGGTRVGVVTSLTFRTVPAPTLALFHLSWPFEVAARTVAAWQAWAPDAPDELAASLHVRTTAEPSDPPEVHLFGTLMGDGDGLAGLLDGFVDRVRAQPDSSAVRTAGHREAKRELAELFPGEEGEIHGKSEYFDRPLPSEAIEALVARIADGRRQGESRVLDFMPWGGAYNRVAADATAFAHRQARFLLKHEAVVTTSDRDAAREWAAASWSVTHPWGTGAVYPNFPEPDVGDWSSAHHGANLDRLRRVSAAYDPEGLFRADRPVAP